MPPEPLGPLGVAGSCVISAEDIPPTPWGCFLVSIRPRWALGTRKGSLSLPDPFLPFHTTSKLPLGILFPCSPTQRCTEREVGPSPTQVSARSGGGEGQEGGRAMEINGTYSVSRLHMLSRITSLSGEGDRVIPTSYMETLRFREVESPGSGTQ